MQRLFGLLVLGAGLFFGYQAITAYIAGTYEDRTFLGRFLHSVGLPSPLWVNLVQDLILIFWGLYLLLERKRPTTPN